MRQNKSYVREQIEHIAQQNPKGFTYSFFKETFVKEGFIVAFEDTQNSHDFSSLDKIIEHAENNCGIIGGWLNTEDGKYYFDSCKVIYDKAEAIEFGKAQNQIAIFDMTTKQEIKL